MNVGIALLTLAPGRMGGSETYARGLTAALAQHGMHEYVVVAPPDADDAAGGLPVITAGAPSAQGRPVAFLRAAAARQALATADIVHYPLTISLPPTSKPRIVTLHDLLHLDLPELVPRHAQTAVEEFADGAAVIFVASVPEDFGNGILRVLDSDHARLERGEAVAHSHSWERVARLHDDVYGELA